MSDFFSPVQLEQWKALYAVGVSPIALYEYLRHVAEHALNCCRVIPMPKSQYEPSEKIKQSYYLLHATSALCLNMVIPLCCQKSFRIPFPSSSHTELTKIVERYKQSVVDPEQALVLPEYLSKRRHLRLLIFECVMLPDFEVAWSPVERYEFCIRSWKRSLANLQETLTKDYLKQIRIFLEMLSPEKGAAKNI